MKELQNGTLRLQNIGEEVTLYGWISKKRNLGGLIFLDLRDRSGIIQCILKPETKDYALVTNLKNESTIKVVGKIAERQNKNSKMKTGDIEVIVEGVELINPSIDLPFEIDDNTTALEETRLKYRYLDLRRPSLQNNLMIRSQVTLTARNYLASLGFIEVETPILCISTPEGARDYLVPSRLYNGRFYALPQSPQIYKQLLMIGGMEKYFQIARCFRDEDLRADRQPEFTQIDIEMSFASEKDIWQVVENLMKEIFSKVKNIQLDAFPHIKYVDCMSRFGSDKPDTRFEMELKTVSSIFLNTTFEMYRKVLDNKGIVKAIVVKNEAATISRKDIDNFTKIIKTYGAQNLSYLKYNNKELTGSISKVMSDEEKNNLITLLALEENDLVLLVADKVAKAETSLGALRVKLGKDLGLIDENKYNFLWVTDFPMFEYSEEENRFVAAHHPFTSPNKEDEDKLLTDKEHCYSRAYDLVINGYELLSGSVRIHDQVLQAKVFEAIGMSEEEAKEKFGFFLEAFKYGAPPHCGVGIGLERLIMILQKTDNIRDVVAFPKTASASCLMTQAPGNVSPKQLKELGININTKE